MKNILHFDLIVVVSNDLSTDRRMKRTCDTLAQHGMRVLLIGRKLKHSTPLEPCSYEQLRLTCTFNKGILFYMELPFQLRKAISRYRYDKLLFVDLDTVFLSRLISKKDRVYFLDLHEYFEEVPELSREFIKKYIWKRIARFSIPKCDIIYTVNDSLAKLFSNLYKRRVSVIRNLPSKRKVEITKFSLPLKSVYLGVLNPGRGLEQIIEVVKHREDITLDIIGDGPLLSVLKKISGDSDNIKFRGMVEPKKLSQYLKHSHICWNILDGQSKSYYFSLANKFFDYAMHGIPIITMRFPEYLNLHSTYKFGYLLEDIQIETLNTTIDRIVKDDNWSHKHEACKTLVSEHNWNLESNRLLKLFGLVK